MPEKSINVHFRIGLKLLASIGCSELLIMVIFRLIRIETWLSPLLVDLTDTLLLCIASSFLIFYWVVKPMKILEEREKAKEALVSVARFPEENPSPVMRLSFDGTILYANPASLPLRRFWNSELGQKVPAGIASTIMDVCGSGVSKEVDVVCGDTVFSLLIASIKNAHYVNIYGRDITERKKADEEIERQQKLRNSLLALHRMADATEGEIFDFALDAGLTFSGSQFGFIGKMSDDELTEVLLSWSKGVLNQCAVTGKLFHFPVAEAGLLGEIVRQRRPIIVNDYETSNELKKGYPEGHVPIQRFLGIPVFNADRIVAVAGWANKEAEYTESDVLSLTALLNETWNLIESKRAAEALLESEGHLRVVLESTADAILAVDHRGKVLWANARFFELWLVPKAIMHTEDDTLILEHVLTQVADPDAFLNKVQELYASEKVSTDTLYLKDGRIFERYSCALMNDGKNVGRLWSFRDITKRKRAEETLRSLTSRNKAILAAVPDIIMEVDNNKVYTWANKAGYAFFGDDVIGKEAAFYFEGEQKIYDIVQPLFSGSEEVIHIESWQRRKDGAKRILAWWCRVLKDSEGTVTGVLSTARDITELRQAENALQDRVKEFGCINDISRLTNEPWMLIDEFVQQAVGILPPAWRYPEICAARIMLNSKEFKTANYRETQWSQSADLIVDRKKYGAVTVCYLEEKPAADEGPFLKEERSLINTIADFLGHIIHHRLSEAEIRASEDRFRIIFDNANDGILLADAESKKFHFANATICRMLGYSQEEIKNMGVMDIHPEKDIPSVIEQFEKQARSEIKVAWDLPVKRKDGSIFYADIHTSPVEISGKSYLLGIFSDITERKQAEEEIHKEKAFSEAILDSLPGIFYVFDHMGRFLRWNRAFKTLSGYSGEEIAAMSPLDFFTGDDRALLKERIEKVFETGASDADARFLSKDGRRTPYYLVGVRFILDGVPCCIGMGIDITERKETEKTIKRYNDELLALADASNVVVSSTNTTNELYETICEIAVKDFGLKMAWLGLVVEDTYDVKIGGQFPLDDGYLKNMKITWDDSPTGMGPIGRAIKTKTVHVSDDINTDTRFAPWREKALKWGFHSFLTAPMITSKGKVIGAINLYKEETRFFTPQRKKLFQIFANQAATAIENALLLEGLEQKVSKRTQEFETANLQLLTLNEELELRRTEADTAKMQADAANRAKSDFLANMSHELRTPLNSIIGFSEILEDGIAGPIADNQKELANDISTSGKHLLSLINDILDLSKVEAGKMELELGEFNIEEMIDGSLVMFKEKAMKQNIKVAAEVEEGIGNIIADERKIKQVLFNLLSNAFKFTPDGGSVRVAARRVVRDQGLGTGGEKLNPKSQPQTRDRDFFEISVTDTGIGIAPEDQKKLFQPFQQIDSALSRKHSGTGLGLNLCKKFIELHGGRIWIESEGGKGSKFIFVISSKGKPSTKKIVDPATSLLTREHVLTHLGRILSFHKRKGRGVGLIRMEVFSDKPVDYAALAEILKKAIRKHEVIGQGESHGWYYIILLEVDRQMVDGAVIRIKKILADNGYSANTATAVYPDDGENIEELLKVLGG